MDLAALCLAFFLLCPHPVATNSPMVEGCTVNDAISVWTSSYLGVSPRLTHSSCSRDTGVLTELVPPLPLSSVSSSLSGFTVFFTVAATSSAATPFEMSERGSVGLIVSASTRYKKNYLKFHRIKIDARIVPYLKLRVSFFWIY